jgi:hypothetical protein
MKETAGVGTRSYFAVSKKIKHRDSRSSLAAGFVLAVFFIHLSSLLFAPNVSAATYSTTFDGAENPISEGGMWVNGKTHGVDWADCATTGGYAYGLQSGQTGFDDSTALLAGTWGPNQSASAIVHLASRGPYEAWEEVEIRLRSTISGRYNSGYEVIFSTKDYPYGYVQIVRWNGALGSFNYITLTYSIPERFVIHDGDEVKGEMIGNKINAYINGVLVASGSDDAFTSGSPGIGFYHQMAGGNLNYGFKSFTATDGVGGGGSNNRPPVAHSQSVSATAGTGIGIVLTGSDPDNDLLAYSIVGGPIHGTLSWVPPNVLYQSDANYSGPDSFSFKVNDGWVDSAPATVSVSVRRGLAPPSITLHPKSQTVAVGSNVAFAVVATGTSPFLYQWYFNTTTAVPGAIDNQILLTDVEQTHAGWYAVRVSNSAGSVISEPAQLIVNEAPPPPPPPPPPTTNDALRSVSVTLSGQKVNSRTANIKAVATLRDQNGKAVPKATLHVTWALPDGTTQSQTNTTASGGRGRFTIKGARGTYTLTVNNITKAGYSFDSANSVVSGSITK